jgi:hypothetical protein
MLLHLFLKGLSQFLHGANTTYGALLFESYRGKSIQYFLISLNIINFILLLTNYGVSEGFMLFHYGVFFVSIIYLCLFRNEKSSAAEYLDVMNQSLKPFFLELSVSNLSLQLNSLISDTKPTMSTSDKKVP